MILSENIANIMKAFAPPPTLTISQHADQYRYLSQEYCAEPGKYHVNRTEYLREIMDSLCDEKVEQTVCMTSARVGKTTFIENVLHYYVDCDPAGGILVCQPTKETCDFFSKVQLSSMIRDNCTLRSKIYDNAADDTLSHKKYPGGTLDIVSASSASALSGKTKRIILLDEVDRYDDNVGGEGDPVSLAIKRAATFFNRKIILCSTPKIKGSSRIEAAFEASDKRYYHIPCSKCGQFFTPKWEHIKWDKSADGTEHHPETAHLECPHCHSNINDAMKNAAVRKGKWIASDPSKTIRGYHLWEIFSPWRTMRETVEDFLAAKNNSEALKAWVNLSLGESWEDKCDSQESAPLFSRKERWDANEIPAGAVLLTAGCDTQDDRLVLQVVGWGLNSQSWIVDYRTIMGRPDDPGTWQRLDQALQRRYQHASGNQLSISTCLVDSGGHFTSSVYEFCRDRESRLIFPCKGVGKDGTPIQSISKSRNDSGVRIIFVGVNNCKSILFSRLKIDDPESNGYIHFSSTLDLQFFEELTSEYLAIKMQNGRERREWKKLRARNEALDCFNYSMAAVEMLNPDFEFLRDRLLPTITGEVPREPIPQPILQIVNPSSSAGWGTQRW